MTFYADTLTIVRIVPYKLLGGTRRLPQVVSRVMGIGPAPTQFARRLTNNRCSNRRRHTPPPLLPDAHSRTGSSLFTLVL
jgi:hypothetical protein